MSAPQPPLSSSESAAASVRVRLFAALREAMGWSEQQVTIGTNPCTPLVLWQQLDLAGAWQVAIGDRSDLNSSHGLPAGVQVAINQQFANAETPLGDGDELAFLPPISGG